MFLTIFRDQIEVISKSLLDRVASLSYIFGFAYFAFDAIYQIVGIAVDVCVSPVGFLTGTIIYSSVPY